MIKRNYHTHTYRCGHAIGTDEEYVKAAIESGIKILGFSDHAPWPNVDNRSHRMSMDMLDDYIESINSLKEKYKEEIENKIQSIFDGAKPINNVEAFLSFKKIILERMLDNL